MIFIIYRDPYYNKVSNSCEILCAVCLICIQIIVIYVGHIAIK